MKKALVAVIVIFVMLFAGYFFFAKFGYSTPIPASNEKEKAYFEKRKKEWEAEQQRLKDIE